VIALAAPAHAGPTPPPAQQQLAHDIYKELIETNTTASSGDTLAAARAMAARLIAAGLAKDDVQVIATAPNRGNLVARLRGTGKKKPILLMAHLDVVEARRADWTTDPFQLVEKDGYFYGRGTSDDKFMAAVWIANLIRYHQEHYKPDRDLIVVLETDEETADPNSLGIKDLLAHHRELIDAELALNEGAGVAVKDGKPAWNSLQTSEKQYQSYWLETKNPGGHASLPRKDNAIYELSDAIGRISKYDFPVDLNETTRAYFQKMSALEHGELASDMRSLVSAKPDPAALVRLSAMAPYNAQMRTTCVATRLEGGHADNALPQVARAMLNCRIVPGETPADVQRRLEEVIADPGVKVTPVGDSVASPPSPLRPDLIAAAEKLTARFWPGTPVVPTMDAGATDGRFLRNAGIACYGHTGLAADIFDVREHGKDERVSTSAFYEGQEYLYELVKLLAGGK
jgi:acetylornithine deacetylase/succinyl-diaminopimelate desuccinylase-like protein